MSLPSASDPMLNRAETDPLNDTSLPHGESSQRRLGDRLIQSALTTNNLGRGGIENADTQNPLRHAETDPEIAEANMQAQILESAQRLFFWVGIIFHSIVLGIGWMGWGIWNRDQCDYPFNWILMSQNIVSTCSLFFTICWRILKVKHPDTFERYVSWKVWWERFNNITLFGLFITVMSFWGLSSHCDSGIKTFTSWYFLTIVIIFPVFFCCGVCGMIFIYVWLSNKVPVGQTMDAHIVDEMEVVQEKDLSDNERESGCAICQEKYDDEQPIIRLYCGHVFHKECVKEWLTKFFDTCPLCRESQIKLKEEMEKGEKADEDDSAQAAGGSAVSPSSERAGLTTYPDHQDSTENSRSVILDMEAPIHRQDSRNGAQSP